MKENIPTKTIKLPKSGKEVKYYAWMTQEESDKHLEIMMGGKDMELQDGKVNTSVSVTAINQARKFLIENVLKDFSFEEFNVLHPSDREAITDILDENREEVETKKK